MFFLNKLSISRRNSRELGLENHIAPHDENMYQMYAETTVAPPEFKPKPLRRLRSRTSIFDFGGSKRRSQEYAAAEEFGDLMRSSSSRTLNVGGKTSSGSLSPRRRLRRVGSKTSLTLSEKSMSRILPDQLFRTGSSDRPATAKAPIGMISQPFNFTHLTHHNPRDAPQIKLGDSRNIGDEWNRALARESNSRPATAIQSRPVTAQPSMQSLHSRSESLATVASVKSRLRSSSNASTISPAESFADLRAPPPPPPPKQEQIQRPNPRHMCPITPPLRSSSRQFVRIAEHPEEDNASFQAQIENTDVPDDMTLFHNNEEVVGQAVTTVGDNSYGRKSIGLRTMQWSPISSPRLDTESPLPPTPEEEEEQEEAEPPLPLLPTEHELPPLPTENALPPIPSECEIFVEQQQKPETPTVPVFNILPLRAAPTVAERRKSTLLSVRTRPLSQLSLASDTLNSTFTVQTNQLMNRSGSIRSRRMSRSMSSHLRSNSDFALDPTDLDLDCWEEDIDWCYEHEADADCDFNWDQGVVAHNASDHSPQFAQPTRAPAPPPLPLQQEQTPQTHSAELANIPEQYHDDEPTIIFDEPTIVEQPHFSERRITGLFEDQLLLPSGLASPKFLPGSAMWGPPSPVRAAPWNSPSPTLEDRRVTRTTRDSGFESSNGTEDSLQSPGFPNTSAFLMNTRQRSASSSPSLPELIPGAVRHSEMTTSPLSGSEDCLLPPSRSPPPRPTLIADSLNKIIVGNRRRANSEATCVTLCSDTDTTTPTETNEAVTPSSSAHNSYNFWKPRSSSVVGVGLAVEGRIDKGLSFPSAAIPGVVEYGPESNDQGMYAENLGFMKYF